MSLRPGASSFCISAQVLQVLLLLSPLLIMMVSGTMGKNGNGKEWYYELRCVCLKITSNIHPSKIQNLEVIKAGPHCPKVEVIATMKNGSKFCLNPDAPSIKKIVQKILEGDNSAA
ncbi:alveolar macrophage chemotactic factor [Erinaceus europaeus]|uniref:C-X-C motif chemokine n=1 Tax=Erinaceus europaeus TaxID=9365 RepID=A0ABM3X4U6_ERIEU|nr:alveolar macrophage chemotactic factor [Erinaceus europaeus]